MNYPNLKSSEILNFLDVDLSCYFNSVNGKNSSNVNNNFNAFVGNTNNNNVNTSPNHIFNSNPNLVDNSMRTSWSPTTMNENNSSVFSLSMDPILLLRGVDEDTNNNNHSYLEDTFSKTSAITSNTFVFSNRVNTGRNEQPHHLSPIDSTNASLSTTSSMSTSIESPSSTCSLRQSSYTMPYSSSFITPYSYQVDNIKSHKETNRYLNNVAQNELNNRSSLPIKLKTSNTSLFLTKPTQKSSSNVDEESNLFSLSNSENELSLFSQQHDQNYDETLNLSSSLPSTISLYLAHLDNNLLESENFNIIESPVETGLIQKNEKSLSLQINTSQATVINANCNVQNNNNNEVNKESDLFQFDDVNLATPTTENASILEQHIQFEQPKTPIETDSKTILSQFDSPTHVNPLLPRSFKPSSNSNMSTKSNQYNSSQIQSFLGSFNQNPSSAAYSAQMNGQMSRSNSQPDLSINVEKLISPNSSLSYNYNNCYPSENTHYIENNLNNYSHENSFNNQQIGSSHNSPIKNNAYSNNAQKNINMINKRHKIRRHPSLSYKNSMSECHEESEDFLSSYFSNNGVINNLSSNDIELNGLNQIFQSNNHAKTQLPNNNNNMSSLNSSDVSSMDDGLCLGIDALTDFLSRGGTCSDLLDDLPDLEDLMSLVTFETASSISTGSSVPIFQPIKETQCDINLPNLSNPSTVSKNPINSGFYDYDEEMDSLMGHNNPISINPNGNPNESVDQRTTKSAPPSPTPQRKKQRPMANLPWNKAWSKMEEEEKSKILKCLTGIINDEMGLREQLEIIRILNPDSKLKPTDTQYVIDFKMIDDDKYKRIKDIIKIHGPLINEKQISDNSSDCSANSCPLAKRELRIKRAQQRLKLKQQKDKRQMVKESKCGLFSNTKVIPLTKVLPEEDIDIDILS